MNNDNNSTNFIVAELSKDSSGSSRQILLSVLGVAILIVAVVGVSFAAFTYTGEGEKANVLSSGTITMTYTESSNGISISNAMPVTEDVGKNLSGDGEYFDFTVQTAIKGNANVAYEVVAVKDETSTIPDEYVKLYLQKGSTLGNYTEEVLAPTQFIPISGNDKIGAPDGSMLLDYGTFSTSGTNYYRFRMWLDPSYVVSSTSETYTVKINVYGGAL